MSKSRIGCATLHVDIQTYPWSPLQVAEGADSAVDTVMDVLLRVDIRVSMGRFMVDCHWNLFGWSTFPGYHFCLMQMNLKSNRSNESPFWWPWFEFPWLMDSRWYASALVRLALQTSSERCAKLRLETVKANKNTHSGEAYWNMVKRESQWWGNIMCCSTHALLFVDESSPDPFVLALLVWHFCAAKGHGIWKLVLPAEGESTSRNHVVLGAFCGGLLNYLVYAGSNGCRGCKWDGRPSGGRYMQKLTPFDAKLWQFLKPPDWHDPCKALADFRTWCRDCDVPGTGGSRISPERGGHVCRVTRRTAAAAEEPEGRVAQHFENSNAHKLSYSLKSEIFASFSVLLFLKNR